MNCQKVTGIVRAEKLEAVERALEAAGAPGVSVSPVTGFGEYANFFRSPPVVRHVRVEVFAVGQDAARIAQTIMDAAHTGCAGDGIVAVEPVRCVYRIRTRTLIEC